MLMNTRLRNNHFSVIKKSGSRFISRSKSDYKILFEKMIRQSMSYAENRLKSTSEIHKTREQYCCSSTMKGCHKNNVKMYRSHQQLTIPKTLKGSQLKNISSVNISNVKNKKLLSSKIPKLLNTMESNKTEYTSEDFSKLISAHCNRSINKTNTHKRSISIIKVKSQPKLANDSSISTINYKNTKEQVLYYDLCDLIQVFHKEKEYLNYTKEMKLQNKSKVVLKNLKKTNCKKFKKIFKHRLPFTRENIELSIYPFYCCAMYKLKYPETCEQFKCPTAKAMTIQVDYPFCPTSITYQSANLNKLDKKYPLINFDDTLKYQTTYASKNYNSHFENHVFKNNFDFFDECNVGSNFISAISTSKSNLDYIGNLETLNTEFEDFIKF